MSNKLPLIGATSADINHTAKIYTYPCGVVDILCCEKPIFREAGYEAGEKWGKAIPAYVPAGSAQPDHMPQQPDEKKPPSPESIERSRRRAKARVRRLALSNDFRWFVTLTLDPTKIDRHDMAAITKKLSQWASDEVKRKGLAYVLVPERHKDGAVHFHGFFNDVLPIVDSGTIKLPGRKKPKKPRSEAERKRMLESGGKVVYNLPDWKIGFTTAIEITGNYPAAVAYVCKYMGKEGDEKVGGRWYYSGGKLREPELQYAELDIDTIEQEYPTGLHEFKVRGARMAVRNGLPGIQLTEDEKAQLMALYEQKKGGNV